MFQKLDEVVEKYNEINKLLMTNEVLSDPKKLMEYNKTLSSMTEIVEKYLDYKNKKEELETYKEEIKTEKNEEMLEMLNMEISSLNEEIPSLEEELKILLLPKLVEMKLHYLLQIFLECLQDMQKEIVGKQK